MRHRLDLSDQVARAKSFVAAYHAKVRLRPDPRPSFENVMDLAEQELLADRGAWLAQSVSDIYFGKYEYFLIDTMSEPSTVPVA